MRFAVDTGGTFTDLMVEDGDGGLYMFKSPTTPKDPIEGVLRALDVAAEGLQMKRSEMLSRGEMFIYGTTHAINAIVTRKTAKTALLVTEGHRDILTLREGGRANAFDFTQPYPSPFVPRALTYEVSGRILASGEEFSPLNEVELERTCDAMKREGVEAVAVCLLWSILNPGHELRVAQLLTKYLPGVPYTLSHQLNPIVREYRRAMSTVIDASLKPMMRAYMHSLADRLRSAGFPGRLVVVTSQGGVVDADEAAEKPIHLLNSGPSMAPVAGRYFGKADEHADTIIVADTGGTTYDVSLVRRGYIPRTRENWIGEKHVGVLTGFPSVDVKSVGAGGGSIAWTDDGGMLHVGPESAGSVPGPACYGRGGTRPTVTDACVLLGYVDPDFFLGGKMKLDVAASRRSIETHVADPLGMSVEDASLAIVSLATENMVQAIADITINQGIDPRSAVLIGGGGAAGLNSVLIARRLQSPKLVIPEVGATMSAAGAIMSDLTAHFQMTGFTRSDAFDCEKVAGILSALRAKCGQFVSEQGAGSLEQDIRLFVEARYLEQVWELEVSLPGNLTSNAEDLQRLIEDFHKTHEEIFAVRDQDSVIEFVSWGANVSCRIRATEGATLARTDSSFDGPKSRKACFSKAGYIDAEVVRLGAMAPGSVIYGPALIESPFTTVVVPPGSVAERKPSGSLSIIPQI